MKKCLEDIFLLNITSELDISGTGETSNSGNQQNTKPATAEALEDIPFQERNNALTNRVMHAAKSYCNICKYSHHPNLDYDSENASDIISIQQDITKRDDKSLEQMVTEVKNLETNDPYLLKFNYQEIDYFFQRCKNRVLGYISQGQDAKAKDLAKTSFTQMMRCVTRFKDLTSSL